MIMRDLIQKVDSFYSATAIENSPEHVALKACNVILGAFSQCADTVNPQTGEFLPLSALELARRVYSTIANPNKHTIDRICFIADFLRDTIGEIISDPREEIIRTHQMLPLQRAKSFDQASIRWLIRRPGESITQKCVLSRRVMTVKREFVPDTLENRLFKEFIRQFIPLLQRFLLEFRHSGMYQNEVQLLNSMKKWLRDDATSIKPWRNLPPNNTLLGNKYYRKIWDAWRKLADFSDTLSSDVLSAPSYRGQILFLCLISRLRDFGVRFASVPAKMNLSHGKFSRGGKLEFADNEIHGIYINDFNKRVQLTLAYTDCILIRVSSITINIRINDVSHIEVNGQTFQCFGLDFLLFIDNVLVPKIIIGAKLRHVSVREDKFATKKHISVDLNNGRPTFFSIEGNIRNSSFFIARQYWNFSGGIFSLPLKEAEACICSELCETRIISDFWHDEYTMADVSHTAADFAKDIYSSLPLKECLHTLLLPDMLDEMSASAQTLKRALEAEDTKGCAEWLPTSIAALFQLLQKSHNAPEEGQVFCFLERFGNTYSITSVVSRAPSFSENLKAVLPESCGLIWERHPSIKNIIDSDTTPAGQLAHVSSIAPFPVLSENGKWSQPRGMQGQLISITERKLRQSLPTIPWKCRFIILSPGIVLPDKYQSLTSNLKREDLVKGAEILHSMQRKCPQYPLWTDDLPTLLVTAHNRNNKLETRPLVSDDHDPIKTVRGQRTKLTTDDVRFTLPKGQKEPYIDLQRGEGQKKESYRVRLHLQRAPEKNITCKLNLYYTFGVANPYSLEFTPVNPVEAGFASIEGEPQCFTDYSNAFAAPEFPPLEKWNESEEKNTKLDREIKSFKRFWKENLDKYSALASFNSESEILQVQRTISFVGQPVMLCPVDNNGTKLSSPVACRPEAFIDRKCYDKFPLITNLIGIRYKKKQYDRIIDVVSFLHESSELPNPEPCVFLYANQDYSVWEICKTGEKINLYKPYSIESWFEQQIKYNVYFIDDSIKTMDWETRKVKIQDNTNIQILYDNQFYDKGEVISIPEEKLALAISEKSEYVYAVFKKNKHNDCIDTYIHLSPPKVRCNAIIYTDEMCWEKFIPFCGVDWGKDEEKRTIRCYPNSFYGSDYAKRRNIETWYALIDNTNPKMLSTKVVSSVPLTSDILQSPIFFNKNLLRRILKNLTKDGRRPFTTSVPQELKKILLSTGRRIMELLKQPYMPYQQKQLLVEVLALYGHFQPDRYGEWLLNEFSAGASFSAVAIGYAIGDLQKIWQRQLWELILEKWQTDRNTSFISLVTGIAISRYEEVLQTIPPETAKIILNDISARLRKCSEQIKSSIKQLPVSERESEVRLERAKIEDSNKQQCRNQLQFLLSMLRLRKSEDEVTKNILHPSAAITRQLQNDIQGLMSLNLHDLTVRVQGEEKKLLDEVYGFLTGAKQDEFMELETADDGEETPEGA